MNNDNDSNDNSNIDNNNLQRKKLLTETLKNFIECVDNHNYDWYEREQKQLKMIFEYSNIKFDIHD